MQSYKPNVYCICEQLKQVYASHFLHKLNLALQFNSTAINRHRACLNTYFAGKSDQKHVTLEIVQRQNRLQVFLQLARI